MPTPSPYDDSELFSLISGGDEQAFEQLYNLYLPQLYPVVFNIVKSELLVRDIIQEVFLCLWMDREKLSEVQIPRHWIFRITYNRAYTWAKKQAVQRRSYENIQQAHEVSLPKNTTEDSLNFTETTRLVKLAIRDLPARSREIYILSREHGLKPAEIAAQTGMSVQVVKNSLLRSGKTVKLFLAKKGVILPLTLILGHL